MKTQLQNATTVSPISLNLILCDNIFLSTFPGNCANGPPSTRGPGLPGVGAERGGGMRGRLAEVAGCQFARFSANFRRRLQKHGQRFVRVLLTDIS